MVSVFISGLLLFSCGGRVRSKIASKFLYFIGTLNVLLAMYIAWPK